MPSNPTRFIINLDRCPDRFRNVQNHFEEQDITFERISAVDARNINPKVIDRFRETYSPYIPRELSSGEIACFLSHVKCWELIVCRQIKGAFIFEDDINLSSTGIPFIRKDSWIPDNVDICQLGASINKPHKVSFRKILHLSNGFSLTRNNTRTAVLSTVGYWISLHGAQIALKLASQSLYGPVDHFLFDPKFDLPHTTQVWTLSPAIVFEEGSFKSTINRNQAQLNNATLPIKNQFKIWWRRKTGKLFIKTLTREIAE